MDTCEGASEGEGLAAGLAASDAAGVELGVGDAAVVQAASIETARTRRPKRAGRGLEERRRNRFAMGTPGCALLAWVEFVLGSMVDGRTPSVDGVFVCVRFVQSYAPHT